MRRAAAPAQKPKRVRVTVYLTESLWQEARAAALAIGAQGEEPATLSALFDESLALGLERLRRKHNRSRPWAPHRSRLPGGRPPTK